MMEYDFEIERIVKEIKKLKARPGNVKKVGLQFPEGLKTRAVELAGEIEEKSGAVTVIFADPCYGACDTKELEAKKLGLDLMVQFGHDPF